MPPLHRTLVVGSLAALVAVPRAAAGQATTPAATPGQTATAAAVSFNQATPGVAFDRIRLPAFIGELVALASPTAPGS